MNKHGHGVNMKTSLSAAIISIVYFSFVDDTDLSMAAKEKNATGEELTPMFQEALDWWAGVLRATGGELALEKSWCYIINFEWNGNNWDYQNIEDMEGSYYLLDKNNEKQHLQRYEVSKESETLGIFISMDGNNRDQRLNL